MQPTSGVGTPTGPRDAWKRASAYRAIEFLRPGMVVGLGAGSTARFAVERISKLIARGELVDILGVPCSRAVGSLAQRLGISLTTLHAHPIIDVTIDGADEVEPESLSLLKGGGGALLREKIVAQASRREIIVVDATKASHLLGEKRAVAVEVVPFGWRSQAIYLESLGAKVQLRRGPANTPFRTDQDNLILDCDFGPIQDPRALSRVLSARAGIAEHGLFVDLATDIVIAGDDGVRHITRRDREAAVRHSFD